MANLNRNEDIGRSNLGVGANDWATEESWWRENYVSRPYVRADQSFDYYSPAYRYGFESANQYRGRQFNEVESDLERGWDSFRGASKSTWQDVKDAVKDAWDRVTGKDDEGIRREARGTVSPDTRL